MAMSDNNKVRESLLEQTYMNSSYWELKGLKKEMSLRVKSISIPYTKLETKTANTGRRYIVGYAPEGEFSITFYDNEDYDIHTYLLNWRTSIFSNQNKYFTYSSTTRKTFWVYLYKFDKNGKKTKVKTYTFENTYILGISDIDLNYDSNSPREITATFISSGIGIA